MDFHKLVLLLRNGLTQHADVGSSHTSGERPLSPGDGDDHGDDGEEGQPPRKKVITQHVM